ncbi:hypothetical protein Tco_1536553, partial [Tanacetum coccineum]
DLLQVVILFALALMDFYKLEITSDLLSIGVQIHEGEYSLKFMCLVEQNCRWEKKTC